MLCKKKEYQRRFDAKYGLSRGERELIRCLLSADASMCASLSDGLLNIESVTKDKLILLARLGRRCGFKRMFGDVEPRLKGLLRYQLTQNAMQMNGMIDLYDALHRQGCHVMMIKGAAMYAKYDLRQPRFMWDVDIAVRPEQRNMVLFAAREAGFCGETAADHSINLKKGRDDVDVHWHIFKHGGAAVSSLVWQQAETVVFRGREFFIPCCLDMLILLLDNEYRNFCIGGTSNRQLKWYLDCGLLINNPSFPGWDAFIERTAALQAEFTVSQMLMQFSACFPEYVSLETAQALQARSNQEPDYKTLLALADYENIQGKYEEEAQKGAMPHRLRRWLEFMRSQYVFLNSQLSPLDHRIALPEFLLIHWRLDSYSELWTKIKQRWSAMRREGTTY